MTITQAIQRLYPGAIFLSPDDNGKTRRFDVISMDVSSKMAIMEESKRLENVMVIPSKKSNVKVKQTWGEKSFQIGSDPESLLHLSYGWSEIILSVYGCEELTMSKEGVTRGPKIVYDKPYEVSYDAPSLQFALSDRARIFLNGKMAGILPRVKPTCLGELDLTERLEKIQATEAAFTAIHTLLHQLISVVPLVLLSTHDIDESQLEVDLCSGFLVDSTEGGTGVCERIFADFMNFVEKAKDFTSQCAHCDSQMGCAMCTYIYGCKNDCLMKSLGVAKMEISDPNPTSLSSDITEEELSVIFGELKEEEESQMFEPSSSDLSLDSNMKTEDGSGMREFTKSETIIKTETDFPPLLEDNC